MRTWSGVVFMTSVVLLAFANGTGTKDGNAEKMVRLFKW